MKNLNCSDLGGSECNFKASGETDEDVKKQMHEHAAKDHAEMFEKMTEEEKTQIDQKMNELLTKQ